MHLFSHVFDVTSDTYSRIRNCKYSLGDSGFRWGHWTGTTILASYTMNLYVSL